MTRIFAATASERTVAKMTLDEAINYLTPIYESATLDGYKEALGVVLKEVKNRTNTNKAIKVLQGN